ncbi:MAG TPA: hypothetical protein VE914_24105 [Candidatus Angelobacter sp.]|nr:hypothetical protein [Candidatus Angelobacter sp.]
MMMSGYGWILLTATAIGGAADHGDRLEQAAGQATNSFAIAIDGSPGVKVVAACLVDWGEEVDVVTLKGEVPQTRKVDAVGLSCQIKKLGSAGKLVVEITKNGRVVSRNASSGSSSVISISLQ